MTTEAIMIPGNQPHCSSNQSNDGKTRVAAYCRVSTGNEEQLSSYYNQIAYYVDKICNNETWEFVDVYADEGITGTKAWLRDDFNRLLEDCRKGLIDLVLVKSISRFARNTVDCLQYVRELRTLNVDVYFENQNIHGKDLASEFMISIYAMHAQEQSISISNNQRWANQSRMKDGVWLPTFLAYGYKVEDFELVKDKMTVPIINLIKGLFLNGYSLAKIKKELEVRNILSPKGNEKWSETMITSILVDPIYRGHLIAQKTYTTDTFPFIRRMNHGELPQYYYYDDHEAYINKEEAEKIDYIFMMRRTQHGTTKGHGKYSNRDEISGKIKCKECGSIMKRIIRSDKKDIGYSCITHIKDKNKCSNKTIMLETIHKGFIVMVNKLKCNEFLLNDYLKELEKLNQYALNKKQINIEEEKYKYIKKQIYETVVSYNRGLCEFAFYIQEIKSLNKEAKNLLKVIGKLRTIVGYEKEIAETKRIRSYLKSIDYLDKYDKNTFSEVVASIDVLNQNILTFHLINGMCITEEVTI